MDTQPKKFIPDPIKSLAAEIEYLNDEYRQGTPQVTDKEYDALFDRLRELDPSHPLLRKGVIEKTPQGERKDKLPIPMYSLDKCKTVEEVLAWLVGKSLDLEKTWIVISPKYNGISMVHEIETKKAWTRGDGEIGLRCDKHFALAESETSLTEGIVFGEMIINRENWNSKFQGRINHLTGRPYKLNHSTVAGMLNSDTPPDRLGMVDFVMYGIADRNMDRMEELRYLNGNKLDASDVQFYAITADLLNKELCSFLYSKWNDNYPIDGLVIDIDNKELREELGRESNMNPAYARALKLDEWAEALNTTITGYNFQISKQGKLKGTVTVEPVEIDGTEVTQASFYNAAYLHGFGLYPGAPVTIKKSGDIIPKIASVHGVTIPLKQDFPNASEFEKATRLAQSRIEAKTIGRLEILICPSCGGPLYLEEDGVEKYCKNPDCKQMIISKFEHFFVTMGVEECGRPTIEALYDAGYKTIEDMLSIKHSDIASMEGFGESSAENLINQFKKLTENVVPFARILHALDLFDGKIGEKTVQTIIDHYGSYVVPIQESVASLCTIKGVSTATAETFLAHVGKRSPIVGSLYMIDFFNVWNSYLVPPKAVAQGDKCINLNVCFSGIRDKELEEKIKEQMGTIASGVSKTLTHLIVADPNQSTSKTVKAREYGCGILTVDQFKEKFNL